MAIAVEASYNKTFEINTTTTDTESVSVHADANCLVVCITSRKVYTNAHLHQARPTSITYDGDSMTEAAYVEFSSYGSNRKESVSVWYLVNPSTGANDLVVTWGVNANRFSYVAFSLSGVDTSDPLGATQTVSDVVGGGSQPKANITTEEDGSFVAACCYVGNTTNQPVLTAQGTTVQSQSQNDASQTPLSVFGQGYEMVASAGSEEVGWNSTYNFYVQLALAEIKASAGRVPDLMQFAMAVI